jgi:hypothetical protein
MNNWCKVDAALTLRDVTSGQAESTTIGKKVVVLWPPDFACAAAEYAVLVHGYNVSQEKARESYARFRWWLEDFQTPAHVLELHWPGDRKWGKLSGACYPAKIATAQECGKLLAEWISEQDPGTTFALIGHSLGCRLVLEAVAELRRTGHVGRLFSVSLMAAAVPVSFVASNRLGPELGDPFKWRLLHSRGDTVLKWIFPFGQSGELLLTGAVGLYGKPAERWSLAGDAWELYQGRPNNPRYYRHGYYWQGGPEESLCEERCYWKRWLHDIPKHHHNRGSSAQLVAERLGARTTRWLPVRHPPAATPLPERLLPLLNGGSN